MTIRLTLILAVTLAGVTTVVTHHDKRPEQLLAASALPAQPLPRQARLRAFRGERRLPLRVKPTPRPRSHPRVIRSGGHLHHDGLNWRALSECEASGNPHAVDPSGTYFGLYQFDLQTWRSVGGSGNPADASPGEQTYRAQLLYAERGRAPWPVCGVYL